MSRPRVGVVGAGRSRNGLGPFLARHCERAGLEVTAIAGRSAQRTASVAAGMSEEFGHEVLVARDVVELAASRLDALVIATPDHAHLAALQAALDAGIACLCEKPLVAPPQLDDGSRVITAFAQRDLLLVESCQWPFTLPVFDELFPGARSGAARIVMGLSPSVVGPAVVPDSLPHLLGMVDAHVPALATLQVAKAALRDHGADAQENEISIEFEDLGGGVPLHAELQLRHEKRQPRPAWLQFGAARMDRRIGAGYAISFVGEGREVAAPDPLAVLVADFARRLRRAVGGAKPERSHYERLRRRFRWFGQVIAELGMAAASGSERR